MAVIVFLAVMILVVTQSGASPAQARADARSAQLALQIETVRRENLVLEELVKFRESDNFVISIAKRELGLVEADDIALELRGQLERRPIAARAVAAPAAAVEEAPGLLDFGYIREWIAQLAGSD
jgi:cell division protein FtsB